MMPKSIGPLTFVFTGSGNVSQGAQEIFQARFLILRLLILIIITPRNFKNLINDPLLLLLFYAMTDCIQSKTIPKTIRP
jgi:hypothetical protein